MSDFGLAVRRRPQAAILSLDLVAEPSLKVKARVEARLVFAKDPSR